MKETRNQNTEKKHSLLENITTRIINKFNNKKNDISKEENDSGDMRDAHTPVSRLDLTGLNREQAKVLIDKIIDEKLEMISHIEFTDLNIDYKERERQRTNAAERINERRNRRRQKEIAPVETIVTEQGVYSDYRHTSVFDVIQPEIFPSEEESAEPIEGQLSMADTIDAVEEAADHQRKHCTTEFGSSYDIDFTDQETPKQDETHGLDKAPGFDEISGLDERRPDEVQFDHVNTTLDASVDKVFAFYETNKAEWIQVSRKIQKKTAEIMKQKILPAAVKGVEITNGKLMPLLQKLESKLGLKKKTAALFAALTKKEKDASDRMYSFIVFIDDINEALICHSLYARDKICCYYVRIKEYAETHKKKLLIGFGAGAVAVAAVSLTIGSMTAYEYIYNGKVLGIAKNQEDVYKTIDIIGDKLSYEYDAEITIDKEKDIRFKKVIAFHQDIDDKEDILNRLTYMRDMKANAHGIFVDGKMVAVLESEKTAQEILNSIQSIYIKQDANIQYKKVGFSENVAVKGVETKLGNIDSKDKAIEYMMTGAVEKKVHAVQSGETFSEIAKMYGLKQSELMTSNPDVIPEKLQIGQEISLNQIVPLVTVQTIEVAEYRETIPYEITYENTSSLYKNEQTVKSKGSNGEKEVVAEIVRNNGVEVGRTEISSTILTQPASQVVLVGTKEPPPLIGTGTYIYPIRGKLTSRYGMRWGRLHSGIDLAASIGTDIKASDGGKVIFAGYNGSLGYTVKIDHGGGRVTLYGHCSKLFVKVGDRVYQGQHIADVGNTGRSTGPHVHFEVQINGKTKNPLNYL